MRNVIRFIVETYTYPILGLALSLGAGMAYSEDASTPSPSPSVVPQIDSIDATECNARIECAPAVRNAIKSAFQRGMNGTRNTEAGFCVFHKIENNRCVNHVEELPYTNEDMKISFKFPTGCRAIFHTHPNASIPEPSENDRKVADRLKVGMFTISSRGIFQYSWINHRIDRVGMVGDQRDCP